MSLSVQQLLVDARRLSSRLREHDGQAEGVAQTAQDLLRGVEAMKEYQEDVDGLNAVAHNRPRAQLVLGIQQENRHIRQLQQENKELRAALEEAQNAVELIMAKYRQHMTYLVSTTKLDKNLINRQRARVSHHRSERERGGGLSYEEKSYKRTCILFLGATPASVDLEEINSSLGHCWPLP